MVTGVSQGLATAFSNCSFLKNHKESSSSDSVVLEKAPGGHTPLSELRFTNDGERTVKQSSPGSHFTGSTFSLCTDGSGSTDVAEERLDSELHISLSICPVIMKRGETVTGSCSPLAFFFHAFSALI